MNLQTQPSLITLHRCNRVRRVRAPLNFDFHFESIHSPPRLPQTHLRVSICLKYDYVSTAHPPAYNSIHSCSRLELPVHDHNASKTPSKSVCQLPQHSGCYTAIGQAYEPAAVNLEGQQIDSILLFLPEKQGAAICASSSSLCGSRAAATSPKQPVSTHQRSFSLLTHHLSVNGEGGRGQYG